MLCSWCEYKASVWSNITAPQFSCRRPWFFAFAALMMGVGQTLLMVDDLNVRALDIRQLLAYLVIILLSKIWAKSFRVAGDVCDVHNMRHVLRDVLVSLSRSCGAFVDWRNKCLFVCLPMSCDASTWQSELCGLTHLGANYALIALAPAAGAYAYNTGARHKPITYTYIYIYIYIYMTIYMWGSSLCAGAFLYSGYTLRPMLTYWNCIFVWCTRRRFSANQQGLCAHLYVYFEYYWSIWKQLLKRNVISIAITDQAFSLSMHDSYQLMARDNVVDGVALLCCGSSCYRWTAVVSSSTWWNLHTHTCTHTPLPPRDEITSSMLWLLLICRWN